MIYDYQTLEQSRPYRSIFKPKREQYWKNTALTSNIVGGLITAIAGGFGGSGVGNIFGMVTKAGNNSIEEGHQADLNMQYQKFKQQLPENDTIDQPQQPIAKTGNDYSGITSSLAKELLKAAQSGNQNNTDNTAVGNDYFRNMGINIDNYGPTGNETAPEYGGQTIETTPTEGTYDWNTNSSGGYSGNEAVGFKEGGPVLVHGGRKGEDDIALVNKHTGADTGIRVASGEMLVFNEELMERLDEAMAKKDKKAVFNLVKETMAKRGEKTGDGGLGFSESGWAKVGDRINAEGFVYEWDGKKWVAKLSEEFQGATVYQNRNSRHTFKELSKEESEKLTKEAAGYGANYFDARKDAVGKYVTEFDPRVEQVKERLQKLRDTETNKNKKEWLDYYLGQLENTEATYRDKDASDYPFRKLMDWVSGGNRAETKAEEDKLDLLNQIDGLYKKIDEYTGSGVSAPAPSTMKPAAQVGGGKGKGKSGSKQAPIDWAARFAENPTFPRIDGKEYDFNNPPATQDEEQDYLTSKRANYIHSGAMIGDTGKPSITVDEKGNVVNAGFVEQYNEDGLPLAYNNMPDYASMINSGTYDRQLENAAASASDENLSTRQGQSKRGVGDMLGSVAGYGYDIFRLVEGMKGADSELPKFSKSPQWVDYMDRMKAESTAGLSAVEMASLQNEADRTYAYDVANVYNLSGGNAGAALGNLGRAASSKYRNQLNIASLDRNAYLNNLSKYGAALGTDINLDRMIFNDDYSNAFMTKQAGAKLASDAITNMMERYTTDRYYGPGSQHYKLKDMQLDQAEENKDILASYKEYVKKNGFGGSYGPQLSMPDENEQTITINGKTYKLTE